MSKISIRNRNPKNQPIKLTKNSSNTWIRRQINDPYVQQAKLDGYRSRSAYKLIEINNKFKIIKPGVNIVDLGAAPGGWSQVLAKITKQNKSEMTKIIAVDLLDMSPIDGVEYLKSDFLDEQTELKIIELLNNKADLILSDMAANTTGNHEIDHIRTANLSLKAIEFAIKILNKNGSFISKIFHGKEERELINKLKENFQCVKYFKPNASRKKSNEIYLIAQKFK